MIITKEIKIKISNNQIKYFKDLGYNTKQKEIIIKIEHLTKGSHVKIDVCCDYCNKSKKLKYNDYNFSISKCKF
jgi:hypothetical protein